jgi:hypothetical protein
VQVTQAASESSLSILDQPASIYDDPPPLTATLFGKKEESPGYEGGNFGPSQAGVVVASLLLVGVFIATSGSGDFSSSSGGRASSSQQQQQQQLSEEQAVDLKQQLAKYEGQLAVDGSDADALEAAAVINARLGNFRASADQLTKLTAQRPDDGDAWRVLAEARGALGEGEGAVAAYQKAWKLSGEGSLEVLTGLADSLVAGGKPEQVRGGGWRCVCAACVYGSGAFQGSQKAAQRNPGLNPGTAPSCIYSDGAVPKQRPPDPHPPTHPPILSAGSSASDLCTPEAAGRQQLHWWRRARPPPCTCLLLMEGAHAGEVTSLERDPAQYPFTDIIAVYFHNNASPANARM